MEGPNGRSMLVALNTKFYLKINRQFLDFQYNKSLFGSKCGKILQVKILPQDSHKFRKYIMHSLISRFKSLCACYGQSPRCLQLLGKVE
jgi:hypothetical protein